MASFDLQEELAPQVRTLQIIIAALAAGVIVFLAGTLVIASPDQGPDGGDAELPLGLGLMTLVALFMTASMVVARVIVPSQMTAAARRRIAAGTWHPPQSTQATEKLLEQTGDAGKLSMIFMMRTIVAAALLEGAAFTSIVAYMQEGSTVALGLAVALAAGILLHFPTAPRVAGWIEAQLRRVEEERDMARGRQA